MSLVLAFTVLCFLMPVYVYVGYPVLLWLAANFRPSPEVKCLDDHHAPTVTLIISCYNEATVIREKLENSLALDYPAGRLRILVVSDGSDDGTDDIVREYQTRGVTLLRQEGRLGKTMGLNLAMEHVESDITVFSDANAVYASDAIRRLVEGFGSPKVGYVVGAALYTDSNAGASARNEGLYWRYELAIKRMESTVSSVVGGDGAIYAIRSQLWEPLDQRDINDFVNPLQLVAKGYRGVFRPEARCFEETAGDFEREVARKERIVNRSIRGLFRVRQVMNPLKTGAFAWQVISHKLLRWLIPGFLMVGVVGSLLLSLAGYSVFQLLTLAAMTVLGLAYLGHSARDKNRLPFWMSFPYYFVAVNWYAVRGIVRAFRGETQVTWTSARPGKEP